jgi:hypothetical protein
VHESDHQKDSLVGAVPLVVEPINQDELLEPLLPPVLFRDLLREFSRAIPKTKPFLRIAVP